MLIKKYFTIALLFIIFITKAQGTIKTKTIKSNGKELELVIPDEDVFFGTYSGRKSGFITLKSDGTGTYKSDFSFGECKNQSFKIEWGFLKDKQGGVVKIKRGYGYSYPIVYKSLEGKRFKGCTEELFFDYLLQKKNGIQVSSSDDWLKK